MSGPDDYAPVGVNGGRHQWIDTFTRSSYFATTVAAAARDGIARVGSEPTPGTGVAAREIVFLAKENERLRSVVRELGEALEDTLRVLTEGCDDPDDYPVIFGAKAALRKAGRLPEEATRGEAGGITGLGRVHEEPRS